MEADRFDVDRPGTVYALIAVILFGTLWGLAFDSSSRLSVAAYLVWDAVIIWGMWRAQKWVFTVLFVFSVVGLFGWVVWALTQERGIPPAWSIVAFLVTATLPVLIRHSTTQRYLGKEVPPSVGTVADI